MKWSYFLAILFIYPVYGQEYHFEHLTSDMGLSQGNVLAIARDYKGFLWLGTEDGLCKFDGYSFKTYRNNPNDPYSLANNMIFNVREDRQKRLWVITRNGFHLYDRLKDRFIHYKFLGEGSFLNNQYISDFLFESDSTAWVTSVFGLVKYNFSTHKIENRLEDFKDIQLIKGIDIHAIHEDTHHNFWVVGNKGCFKVDFKRKCVVKIIFTTENGQVLQTGASDFYEDRNGEFWIATTGQGIFILDNENRILHRLNTKSSNLSNDDLNFIRPDSDHNIWIGTNSGLNIIHSQHILNHTYTCVNLRHTYYDQYSILSDIVTAFYLDNEGRVWIGSSIWGGRLL